MMTDTMDLDSAEKFRQLEQELVAHAPEAVSYTHLTLPTRTRV